MDDDLFGESSTAEQPGLPPRMDFYGAYTHGIDAKGRIIIPNAYRPALGDVFNIGPTRDFRGIALYPESTYQKILHELNSLNQRNTDVQDYTRQFYKLSYRDVQADGQGRLLLPPNIRQRILGDAKELEISGVFDHVRIEGIKQATHGDEAFMHDLPRIQTSIGNQNPS